MFSLIFNFPSRTSIGGISKGYPLFISPGPPKAKQSGPSCCVSSIQSPQEKDRLAGYLIKVTLPVELAPAPLAWCLGVRSPLLELLRFQHLIFCQVFYPHVTVGMAYAKRPPSNLYMLPMLCSSGSKPFTPKFSSYVKERYYFLILEIRFNSRSDSLFLMTARLS